MKVPKLFRLDKEYEYDFKKEETSKKIQKQKIRNIRDLILEPEEVGEDYEGDYQGNSLEEDFREYYEHINFKDIKGDHYRWYTKGFDEETEEAEESINLYVLEYPTRDSLLKHLEDIYEEAARTFEEPHDPATSMALIVDQYVLIICGDKSNKQELNNMEKIYRERFGAKRLIKKKVQSPFELK